MELRITNPQENWLTEQILWNNEELKAAIAEKVKDYKTIAYTEDSLKDMKADRADLNKLKKAFEDERKRIKKICMEPYTKFEQQVKGWNGKGQYIQLATGISYKTEDGDIVNCEHDAIGNMAIAFCGTSGVQMGWLASQADMLSEDWKFAE